MFSKILQQIRQGSKESTGSSDTDSSSDDESIQAPSIGPPEPSDKVQQAKETEAGAEISALVNYVQPVHFNSFENSESKFGALGRARAVRKFLHPRAL